MKLTQSDKLPGRSERLLALHDLLSRPVAGGQTVLRYADENHIDAISARAHSSREFDGSGMTIPRGVSLLEHELADSLAVRLGASVMNFGPATHEQNIHSIDPLKAAGWGTAPANVQPETLLSTLEPKRVWAIITVSRQLAIQAGLVGSAMVLRQIHSAIANAIDHAVFNGTGEDGEPRGILHDADIPREVINADTALATGQFFDSIKDTADAGHEPSHIVMSTALRRELQGFEPWQLERNMPPASATRHLPGRSLVTGDWRELVVAHWGEVRVLVNPYSEDAEGNIRITATMYCDIIPARPDAFAIVAEAPPEPDPE